MTKDDDTKTQESRTPKWLQDGISGAFSDTIKAILLPFLLVTILAGLGFIFYLNSIYIHFSIDIPAYQIGIGFAIATIIVYFNQKYIRKMFRRYKWRSAHGFLWKNNNRDELSGPYCPICKAHVVEVKTSYEKQIEDGFKIMQGGKTKHIFKCSNPRCTSEERQLDFDLQTLIQKVFNEYYSGI
ncbi:MAG TPA: hypothetical protein DCX54_07120 [Flavobacteriales bacterium]|nr:hypothetical protein [Flavobacteriales bacterium]